MGVGGDPDSNSTHCGAPFEYYVRIEGEAVTRSVKKRELAPALWMRMVALELGKMELAGEFEACTSPERYNHLVAIPMTSFMMEHTIDERTGYRSSRWYN